MKKSNFSIDEREYFTRRLDDFLASRNWDRREFNNKVIYTKNGSEYPPINFLDRSPKKILSSPIVIIKEMEGYFLRGGYRRRVENNIAIDGGVRDTFLIGAGVQYFRECFWGDETPLGGSYFLPQPVIRMNSLKRICEGFTSSFVNTSTVKLYADFDEYIECLDNWFSLFSNLGLYIGDFNLEIISSERYGQGKKGNWSYTDGFSVSINYLNLNLGDAGFIRIPHKAKYLEIIDIGFGLERILWALYKSPSYFDMIGPKTETKNLRINLMDSVRSATLLSMSNIENANKDSYNQFRKFTKIASSYYSLFDCFKLVEHYYSFWSQFILPQKSLSYTYSFLDAKISEEVA